MKKLGRIVVFTALVLFASAAFSNIWEIDYHYYSDGTFTNQVGDDDQLCDGGDIQWGDITTNWRVRDRTNCNDGLPGGHACQEFVNGSWTFVTCPPGV